MKFKPIQKLTVTRTLSWGGQNEGYIAFNPTIYEKSYQTVILLKQQARVN